MSNNSNEPSAGPVRPWPLPKRIPGAALDRERCPSLADRVAALESIERELRAGGAL
jgi:hypothetical protein